MERNKKENIKPIKALKILRHHIRNKWPVQRVTFT